MCSRVYVAYAAGRLEASCDMKQRLLVSNAKSSAMQDGVPGPVTAVKLHGCTCTHHILYNVLVS